MDFFGILDKIFDNFMWQSALNLLFVVIYVSSIVVMIRNRNCVACQTVAVPIILAFVTLFNPIVYSIVAEKTSVSGIYGRFFWMFTVFIVDAIALATVVGTQKDKRMVTLGLVFCGSLLIAGGGKQIQYSESENIYKIPQYIIDIDKAINEAKNEDNPTVISYEDVFYYIRQYDPAILLYGNLGFVTDSMKEQMGDETYGLYGQAYEFLTASQGYEVEMSENELNAFISVLSIDFICSKSDRMLEMNLRDYDVECVYADEATYVFQLTER